MKKSTIWPCAVFLLAAAPLAGLAQQVALGHAVFDASSDQGTPECYEPLAVGVVNTYEGFGSNQGNTRTEGYSAGGLVAGVKTVKRQVIETTPAGTTTEDWWLAYDTEDNLRVLKFARSGAVVFAATSSQAPPLFLPANPATDDTWTLFGQTFAVIYPSVAESTALLRIRVTSASGIQWVQYSCGVGRTVTEIGEGSGWQLKAAE
jgi:hypothetical protein